MKTCDCGFAYNHSGCQSERKADVFPAPSLFSLCLDFDAATFVNLNKYFATVALENGGRGQSYFSLFIPRFECGFHTMWAGVPPDKRETIILQIKKLRTRDKQLAQSHAVNKCQSKNLNSMNVAPEWRHWTPALHCNAGFYKSRVILLGDQVLRLICSWKWLLAKSPWKSLRKA